MGWAELYPAELGMYDFSSVACKQMEKLECKTPGWKHPENKCPASGSVTLPLEGSNYILAHEMYNIE